MLIITKEYLYLHITFKQNAMEEHTKLMLVEEEKLWQEYVTKRDTLGADHKETQHAFSLYNLMLKLLKETL